jgi:hypothetical protein
LSRNQIIVTRTYYDDEDTGRRITQFEARSGAADRLPAHGGWLWTAIQTFQKKADSLDTALRRADSIRFTPWLPDASALVHFQLTLEGT